MSDGCVTCMGTGPGSPVDDCPLAMVENMGIDVFINGNIVTFTAPDGVTIDTQRLSNSWDTVNKQLPTGSLNGYISSIFDNVGATLAQDAGDALGVILGTIILIIFILYAITFITLMAYGTVGVAMGITLILIGLIVIVIAVVIALFEAYSLGNSLRQELFNETSSIMDNLWCALLSGICCYSGFSCCCPNGTGALCTNQPFPPP